MSISTVSSATRHFRRSPSSIVSTDSDIRFTRKKLSSQYRCGCCIIASFLFLLLVAGASVYVGYTYFASQMPDEQVFRGTFRVTEGDTFSPELADPSTKNFLSRARDYRERLNLLFRRSSIKSGFAGSDILALDGTEGEDLVVHFNVHIDPTYIDVTDKDLKHILIKEISRDNSLFFQNLTIDLSSLQLKESHVIPQTTVTTVQPKRITQAVTNPPPPPRKCVPIQVPYCSKLNHTLTSYPNILGHKNLKDVEEDFIAFRELVDAECHRQAYEFVCQVLQPPCKKRKLEDEMVLPCRSFCRDFLAGCGGRLLPKLTKLLDCSRFPEYVDGARCTPKPDCVKDMQVQALSPRICDGVVDCQDLTDEKSCSYCPKDHVHCGVGRTCISPDKRCNGHVDCPDGSDERACLSLAPSVANLTSFPTITPHLNRYHQEGFVVFNEKGLIGKVCTENVNINTTTDNSTSNILETVASSLCQTLTYEKVKSVEIVKDDEKSIPYVSMKDPTAPEISFIRTSCDSRKVLKVTCSNLDCGFQPTHTSSGVQGLSKMASPGDWPWHVMLFKEEVHVCDATLASPEWLITTASCFQGQPKAEWTARLGGTRLSSSAPWEHERRIVGLVKSPVEGSTIAMVKLDAPVVLSDFVRPVCLPKDEKGMLLSNVTYCNTLGWTRNREQLQRVQVKLDPMEKCENVTISTVNSVCTDATYGQNDCHEEEFAGSPMLCLMPDGVRWAIFGVSNWRIACPKSGVNRPRMYDKITSNVDWILETISAIP